MSNILHNKYIPVNTSYNYMNNKNMKQNVLATIAMVAAISILSGLNTVNAHTPNTLPYGEVGQEDELYFQHHGSIYINAVPSQGNGLFMEITDIDTDYTVDQAIERFGIMEDTNSFLVQPSLYSEVNLVFMFNDEKLNFQLIGAIQQ